MKKRYGFLCLVFVLFGSTTSAQIRIDIDLENPYAQIKPTMWGVFFEDINFAADGGLYAELIKNRSFEFIRPMTGWQTVNEAEGSGDVYILNRAEQQENPRFVRLVSSNEPGRFGIENEGFRGLPIRQGVGYRFSVLARVKEGTQVKIVLQLLDSTGQQAGETMLDIGANAWKKHTARLQSDRTDPQGSFRLLIEGQGTVEMDMISLFPEDTWKERENGMRSDLVQMLADLQPGFVRFPGGCIVEGHELATRYQWKRTVGHVEARRTMINRWNTEMWNRQAPDYFQSFGLGFYEYFLLSEDLGAEPLPIINCGMACQYNTGELAPLDELDPYIQDALDLIDFANGPVDSHWGKLRAEMGHPEPFHLKYIGIGNEQWGPQYVERYPYFAKAIREKYPEIQLVSGSGPRPNDERFEYLWTQLPHMDVDVVDEHFYMPPEWFTQNADRYDSFDRNGPVIFPGEYAAHGQAGDYPSSRNTWLSALSEAAFMTGFERNADIVHMCSYAPLMAHVDAWQWRPDLIWFDNLQVFGSPNYHVHKLYATHAGTHVVHSLHKGEALSGQDSIYVSTTLDMNRKELYLKIANTATSPRALDLRLRGKQINKSGMVSLMQSGDPMAYNSIEEPEKIFPLEKALEKTGKSFIYEAPPQSFQLIVLSWR